MQITSCIRQMGLVEGKVTHKLHERRFHLAAHDAATTPNNA